MFSSTNSFYLYLVVETAAVGGGEWVEGEGGGIGGQGLGGGGWSKGG